MKRRTGPCFGIRGNNKVSGRPGRKRHDRVAGSRSTLRAALALLAPQFPHREAELLHSSMGEVNMLANKPERAFNLTAEQVRQYETDGFLVLPGHLDPGTAAELVRGTEELAGRVGPIQPGTPRIQVDRIGEEYRLR